MRDIDSLSIIDYPKMLSLNVIFYHYYILLTI